MDHIKEKLSKITPSIWQCSLRSKSNVAEKTENVSSPDVATTCYLSLESPSDFLSKSPYAKNNASETSKVYFIIIDTFVTTKHWQIWQKLSLFLHLLLYFSGFNWIGKSTRKRRRLSHIKWSSVRNSKCSIFLYNSIIYHKNSTRPIKKKCKNIG